MSLCPLELLPELSPGKEVPQEHHPASSHCGGRQGQARGGRQSEGPAGVSDDKLQHGRHLQHGGRASVRPL